MKKKSKTKKTGKVKLEYNIYKISKIQHCSNVESTTLQANPK